MPSEETTPLNREAQLEETIRRLLLENAVLREGLSAAKELLQEKDQQITSLTQRLESAAHRIEGLEYKLDRAFQRLYGRSSEIVDPHQLTLFADGNGMPAIEPKPEEKQEESSAGSSRKRKRKGHGRALFPETLPRNEIVMDVPDEDKVCHCELCQGKPKVRIGEEVTERGDYHPGQLVVNRYVRPKWACSHGNDGVAVAEAPSALLDKAKYEPSVFAHIVNAKFGDHIPLNRLSGMWERQGWSIPTSTMWDMVQCTASLLAPVLRQMIAELLTERYLQVDETPIQVNVKGEGTKKGYLWVWRAGKKVVFRFTMSRSRAGPLEFLGDWKGLLQKDDYSGYNAVVNRNGITEFACWAHARRKFKDAREVARAECDVALWWIGRLYRIEDRMKQRAEERNLSHSEFLDLRQEKRQGRMKRYLLCLKEQLDRWQADPGILPKSPLGTAVSYALNLWPQLMRFLDYPEVEIDNNRAENAIRPVAVGRRNYLFTGSPKGGDCCATLYSLIGTCKALNIPAEKYLLDLLGRISTTPQSQIAELTPWAWKQEREISAGTQSAACLAEVPVPV